MRCYTETWDECESLRRRILEERGEAKATKTARAAMLHLELWIRLHHELHLNVWNSLLSATDFVVHI